MNAPTSSPTQPTTGPETVPGRAGSLPARPLRVAVLGATGAVGQELLELLAERSFPVAELRLLASPRSAGQTISWRGDLLRVNPVEEGCFADIDLVLAPLAARQPIRRVIISTYQSASGAGARAMEELRQLSQVVLDGGTPASEVLPHSLAFNLFLHNSPLQTSGYCEEELKMLHETRKIMGLPELRLSATCVRVPVLRAHSEAVNIEFEEPLDPAEARSLLASAPGVELIDDWTAQRFPMPTDVTGRDPVAVGRIRQDLSEPKALELWLCGDQIRKGAALNAIQIAELLQGRTVAAAPGPGGAT